jgi:hypothetical protein
MVTFPGNFEELEGIEMAVLNSSGQFPDSGYPPVGTKEGVPQ